MIGSQSEAGVRFIMTYLIGAQWTVPGLEVSQPAQRKNSFIGVMIIIIFISRSIYPYIWAYMSQITFMNHNNFSLFMDH